MLHSLAALGEYKLLGDTLGGVKGCPKHRCRLKPLARAGVCKAIDGYLTYILILPKVVHELTNQHCVFRMTTL